METGLGAKGIILTGGQWGDEGKGRIVDVLSEDCDIVVRFQGGNNAGHSLHIGDQTTVLHLIPCGIMREDKVCVIGNGVVIDPLILLKEMEMLSALKVPCHAGNLKIAKNAHLIFPFHIVIDSNREARAESPIGTTKRGIGPCYEDKVARLGIRAGDLMCERVVENKLRSIFSQRPLGEYAGSLAERSFLDETLFVAKKYREILEPFLCDVGEYLEQGFRQGKKILFEGAQGALLDVDHGTYPFVTSSNCVAAQACIGSGIGMKWIDEVLMVSKAYCTRVGAGPFFTEMAPEDQERLRDLGDEFGATTSRPRRCGWLDLVALKYAARINGATGLIITKVDVLSKFGAIKVATGYRHQHRSISFLDGSELHRAGKEFEIIYYDMPQIEAPMGAVSQIGDLPIGIVQLLELIERIVELPVRMVSYGPKRGQEIFIRH